MNMSYEYVTSICILLSIEEADALAGYLGTGIKPPLFVRDFLNALDQAIVGAGEEETE